MNYEFTPEYYESLKRFRAVLDSEIAPHVTELDGASVERCEELLLGNMKALAKTGFLSMPFSADVGGGARPWIEWTLFAEAVAAACPSTFLSASASAFTAGLPLVLFGSTEQKSRFAAPILSGDKIAAFAHSEPDGASDPAAVKATAVPTNGGWLLSGEKFYVTNAPIADFFVVSARTGSSGPEGISLFVVEAGTSGLKVGERHNLMGHRGVPVGNITFKDCLVKNENLIGKENAGFGYAMHALQAARLCAAAGAIGLGVAGLGLSIDRARSRQSLGAKLIKHQEVSFKLAQMRLMTDVGRLLTQKAADSVDRGSPDAGSDVSCAKVYATESASKIANWAVQIFGAEGYTHGFPVERLYRDARLGEILGGPSEIHRIMLAREILSKVAP